MNICELLEKTNNIHSETSSSEQDVVSGKGLIVLPNANQIVNKHQDSPMMQSSTDSGANANGLDHDASLGGKPENMGSNENASIELDYSNRSDINQESEAANSTSDHLNSNNSINNENVNMSNLTTTMFNSTSNLNDDSNNDDDVVDYNSKYI
jgi:hypothetical protein